LKIESILLLFGFRASSRDPFRGIGKPEGMSMYPAVKAVTPKNNWQLELTFDTGEVRSFDMSRYLDHGVFSRLRNPALWQAVKVVLDSIEWPDGIDVDPEILYRDSIPLVASTN